MILSNNISRDSHASSGFTLIELLITVSIMAMMASMLLFALYSAQETSREQKTKSIIAKLDSVIKTKWESYRTRRVPINTTGLSPIQAAKVRLDGLRDLMRMEMPDRWQDVLDVPATIANGASLSIANRPALNRGYLRRIQNLPVPITGPTPLENAECLYLIVTALAMEGEIDIDTIPSADTDNNKMPEFIDGWGKPIRWIRWPAGFQSDLQTVASGTVASASPASGQTVTITATGTGFSQSPGAYVGGTLAVLDLATNEIVPSQMGRITAYTFSNPTATFTCSSSNTVSTNNSPTFRGTTNQQVFGGSSVNSGASFVVMGPDPFDPTGIYPMYASSSATPPNPDTSIPSFALYPLIYSAGPDKLYGTKFTAGGAVVFSYGAVNDNPMIVPNDPDNRFIGTQKDDLGLSGHGWLDNIHNHILSVK